MRNFGIVAILLAYTAISNTSVASRQVSLVRNNNFSNFEIVYPIAQANKFLLVSGNTNLWTG
jgi:hypothetical protein